MAPTRVLCVCSRNQWRSPTAERVINGFPGFQARSAGTSSKAQVKVSEKLLAWADVVLVMEREHWRRIRERFPDLTRGKEHFCLDIPDRFQFMDAELVELIHRRFRELFPANDEPDAA